MNKNNSNLHEKIVALLNYLQQHPKSLSQEPSSKKQQLEALSNAYRGCTECPLGSLGRNNVVFGEGNPEAHIMFVGEGPGRNEDLQARPFVGRAGQLLTKIINAMNLDRREVYITNVVKCRPPGNRAPLPIESSTCTQLLLFKQIAIIKPRIICSLGASATRAFLGESTLISQARGRFVAIHDFLLMPTYHPAYLLRNPAEKKKVWEDMKKIMENLSVK